MGLAWKRGSGSPSPLFAIGHGQFGDVWQCDISSRNRTGNLPKLKGSNRHRNSRAFFPGKSSLKGGLRGGNSIARFRSPEHFSYSYIYILYIYNSSTCRWNILFYTHSIQFLDQNHSHETAILHNLIIFPWYFHHISIYFLFSLPSLTTETTFDMLRSALRAAVFPGGPELRWARHALGGLWRGPSPQQTLCQVGNWGTGDFSLSLDMFGWVDE